MQDVRTRICWNSGTGQAFTTAAQSEFALDLGAVDKELGISKLILHILVKTSFDALASGVNLQLIDATADDLTTGQRVLAEISAVTLANVAAGKHHQIPVPPRKLQRYLGFEWEPVGSGGGEDPTVGNIIAWFDEQPESEVV